jgi:hypothetical protein
MEFHHRITAFMLVVANQNPCDPHQPPSLLLRRLNQVMDVLLRRIDGLLDKALVLGIVLCSAGDIQVPDRGTKADPFDFLLLGCNLLLELGLARRRFRVLRGRCWVGRRRSQLDSSNPLDESLCINLRVSVCLWPQPLPPGA